MENDWVQRTLDIIRSLSLSLLLFFQVNELGFNINIECKIKDANKQASTCKCARVNICPMHIF